MVKEFTLPDLGEGVETGDVLQILVAVGDVISAGQVVMELETGKATVEVPCDVAGRVEEVLVAEGDTIAVGGLVLKVAEAAASGAEAGETAAAPKPDPAAARPTAVQPAAVSTRSKVTPAADIAVPVQAPRANQSAAAASDGIQPVAATPSTRRMARELGVEIREVLGSGFGSGPGGRVSKDDVKAFVQQSLGDQATATPATPASAAAFAKRAGGGHRSQVEERQPFKSVRKLTAEHVARAWSTIPHVFQFEKADVTELLALRQRHKATAEAGGGKLTVTVLVIQAAINALKAYPRFNSTLDLAAEELVIKYEYNIGVAVETPRGLLVPVIRDAGRKSIFELAAELTDLAQRARDGKISQAELSGGTFTVTNLGGIGGTGFTPIINSPEVAILGVARTREEPVIRDGVIQPRQMLPLTVSYDHRVIDGADGARFARAIAESLETPERLLLGG